MQEQKNLILAIVLSVAIIVLFQFFFPQQSMINSKQEVQVQDDLNNNITSIDQVQENEVSTTKSKDAILSTGKRISINNNNVKGSINLEGAIIDDLILLKYKESLNENAKNISLLSPNGTSNPYYIEIGWKQLNNTSSNIILPNEKTLWRTSSSELTQNSPVTLSWKNNENITFKIHISIDDFYLFKINQEIINESEKNIKVFPYRFIKRVNKPKTINFFILHEGLISMLNETLLEKDYDDMIDDCSTNLQTKDQFCDQKSNGGWLGFTDKYWFTALIPDNKEVVNVNFRHSNNSGSDDFRIGYAGNIINVQPHEIHSYKGMLFAGAKVVKILNEYQDELGVVRFNDSIDWGWFSFLTKPIFYAINWFYQKVGNFGIAIIGFTILMRIFLFPLAQASFKSMAKMKKLQPEMQRLKELHGDDRQKMQQELMGLYKREGANPISGCLPIFLQIPIFFALYKTLFVTIEMYHAPFYGWIHDLSAPDPAGILILFGLLKWDVPGFLSIFNIGVLPIVMGLTMYLQQKLNPAPTDPVQARIFTFLPFVFTFILAGFAAGLVLYWSVNNILSILQQWIIQRKIIGKK
ncbi:MAG: Membrane protein insertase YidC [Alphaproteobacteria bacterium MarineAlpha5_Bin11]|nr:MAG: Membrane protein insertase YidC [Alphaproteobacteria bacterium MarineAlpha5_Bin11]PPR51953.1 MAG: Membrane protein insertase YidC [Alphaproteobacteria bacterium MarineAlpha5_Bin10]|tara:strand:- start:1002 stop:2744 length:1743 start_codon:yes stop_codon:yes gene_type:complete